MGEVTVDRVLHDLKIVAQLREGDKLCMGEGGLCVMHPHVLNVLVRWARGDSRTKSIHTVQSSIEDALALAEGSVERATRLAAARSPGALDAHARHLACSQVRRLHRAVEGAMLGLRCLKTTYVGDESTVARIDVLREGVSPRLRALEAWLGTDSPPPAPLAERRLALESFAGCLLLSQEDLQ